MKFKLDENMPTSAVDLFRQQKHDVHTVFDEALNGEVDKKVADTCRKEQRVLITLGIYGLNSHTFYLDSVPIE